MKPKLLKGFLGFVLATISPFFILAMLGLFYVMFQIIGGATLSDAFESFINIILSLRPIFPYLTTIPVIMVLIIVFMKNRGRF